eukprot:6201344-Pleurochrysis_carterae.AAC.3
MVALLLLLECPVGDGPLCVMIGTVVSRWRRTSLPYVTLYNLMNVSICARQTNIIIACAVLTSDKLCQTTKASHIH